VSEAQERAIEVHDDPDLSHRTWSVQAVGRWLLALVIVAALAGMVGHGPLSWTSARADDGRLTIEYERFGRRGGSQDVTIEVAGALATEGQWTVVLSGALATKHELTTITPEPASMRAVADGVELTFEQVGDADLAAVVSLTPGGMWRESSAVAVPDSGRVGLEQFIYP
jgi:hypothetical protein